MEKTKLYGGIYSGDWVRCTNCGSVMLLPHGADKCPECEVTGCLDWVSEFDNEHEVHRDYLLDNGVEVECTMKDLKLSDFLCDVNLKFVVYNSRNQFLAEFDLLKDAIEYKDLYEPKNELFSIECEILN